MSYNIKKETIKLYKLKDSLMGIRPKARQSIDDKQNIILDGVEVPSCNMEGEVLSHLSVKEYINAGWKGYYRNNISFQVSDMQYEIFNKKQMQILAMECYLFMKKFLPIEWTKEITDCDDFMALYKGIFAVILWNSGIRNAGSCVGGVKIKTDKGGHALNFTLINEGYTLYLIEPQNGKLYKLTDKSTEIFYLDI